MSITPKNIPATTPTPTTPTTTTTTTNRTATTTNSDRILDRNAQQTNNQWDAPDIERSTEPTTAPETAPMIEPPTPAAPITEWEWTQPDYVGQNIALSQAEYMQQSKEQEEFLRNQRSVQTQIDTLSGEMQQLQSSELIRKTSDDLNKLKQNIAYLGRQWQPWESAVKMEAISKQVADADRVFMNLKRLETDKESMRTLWLEYDANAFERQMVQMQNELNTNVNVAIQEALNWLNAAEMKWEMDTVEDVERLRGTLFQNLDKAISGKVIANATDRKMIIDRYNQVIAEWEAFVKNKSVVNKDLSSAMWYYIDGNGNPLLNTQGWTIAIPKEAPMEPIFDKESGNLLTFSIDNSGKMVTTVQKILSWQQQTGEPRKQASNGTYYRTNAQWQLETSGTQSQTGTQQLTSKEKLDWAKALNSGDVTQAEYNNAVYWGWVSEWGQATSQYTWPNYTAASVEQVQAAYTQAMFQWDGANGWQCWSFVNNYLQNMGIDRLFKDPIDVKKAVKNSTTPTIWSIAIMDSLSQPKYGHVGIVTSVNTDWTVTLKQSNKDGSEKVFTSKRNISDIYGFFDPQIPQNEALISNRNENNWEITIDDITSFNDAVERRKMKSKDVNRIWKEKKAIMSDPNASIDDIIAWSQWGKQVWETQSKSFIKFDQAMAWLTAVQKEIKKMKTWPIIGKLKNINPYDTNAQTLKVMLQWLVPTLARWVYGEVGVLTDNDIRLYAKTLPNLHSTKDVNNAVLAYTLDVLAGWYKSQLKSLAWQWYDVSGMSGMYNDIKWQASSLKDELWIKQNQTYQTSNTNNINNTNTSWIGRRQAAQH